MAAHRAHHATAAYGAEPVARLASVLSNGPRNLRRYLEGKYNPFKACASRYKQGLVWLIDSGANTIVVPTDDPNIVERFESFATADTAGGTIVT